MDCSVSKIRRTLAIVAVFTALVFVSLMSMSGPAAAGPLNLTVYGWVYDSGGLPIEGADVVVQVQAGVFHSEASTTDVDGFYQVEFDLSYWNIGDTIRTTATYNTEQEFEEEIADADGTLQIDVNFAFAIPEFGSFPGVIIATVLVGSVALMSMRRRRAQ